MEAALLKPLTDVLEDIQRRIKQHGPLLGENETRTRRSLIDPLLDILGWDTQNPDHVLHEYKVSAGRADYALMRTDGKPLIAIEAKRLGETLQPHTLQVVTYATMAGIPYCGLTDGNVWEAYDVFDQKPMEDKRILRVTVTEDPIPETALQLTLLWRQTAAKGKPVPANRPLLQWSQQAMTSHLDGATKQEWTPLPEFDKADPDRLPTKAKFPDGTEKQLKNARALLIETATWLHNKGFLTSDMIPVKHGQKLNLVEPDTLPMQTQKRRYVQSHGIGLRIYVNFTKSGCRKAAIKLTALCGQNPASIGVH